MAQIRIYLQEFKRKYPCKLWTWFMNCKLITWQTFAGNLCINYSCCRNEFILDGHIRISEGITRLIQHKITGSLHKRIKKLQTDIVKTALEFENYNQYCADYVVLEFENYKQYFADHVVLVSTMQALDLFQYAITVRKQNARSWQNEDEKHLSLFLYRAQNLTSFLLYL